MTQWLDSFGTSLNPAQREAVLGLATSDAALAVLVGPAGTGKSYVAGLFDAAWRDVSAAAATASRADGSSGSRPRRLPPTSSPRTASPTPRTSQRSWPRSVASAAARPLPGDEALRLGARDVLVVDEASMADTYALTRLQAAVDAAGARLVLMGDPRQLGPVGAGGMMRAAIDRDAETYSLADVRRFTHEWERDASLQLRDATRTGSRTPSPRTTSAAGCSTAAPSRTR